MSQTPLERRLARLADTANRKAARLGAPGRLTSVDLLLVLEASDRGEGYECAYCGIGISPMSASFDHVDPFDRQGRNERENLVACCMTCQRTKFTKSPDELRQWVGLRVECPVCGTVFRPRWNDWVRGYGRYCSRKCSGTIGGRA